KMHETDRLCLRATVRTGNARDRDRTIRARSFQCAFSHGSGRLAAHCAVVTKCSGRNAKQLLFRPIRVRNETALEYVRRSGDRSKRRSDKAAGARFRRGDAHTPCPIQIEQALGALAQGASAHSVLQGNRIVAVAMAKIPSPRPVKPSFSLVVALTATRS